MVILTVTMTEAVAMVLNCSSKTKLVFSCRLGMLPAEQAAPLKLLEKGVSKEALAGLVLLEFPCELASAVLAGRWASSPTPFNPFMLGYKIRLVMAAAVTLVVSQQCLPVCLSVCLPACLPACACRFMS